LKKQLLEDALKVFRLRLQEIDEQNAEKQREKANIDNNIGFVYYSQGKYEKVLEFYQKSLDSRIKIYGEEHPDTATSYFNFFATCIFRIFPHLQVDNNESLE